MIIARGQAQLLTEAYSCFLLMLYICNSYFAGLVTFMGQVFALGQCRKISHIGWRTDLQIQISANSDFGRQRSPASGSRSELGQ